MTAVWLRMCVANIWLTMGVTAVLLRMGGTAVWLKIGVAAVWLRMGVAAILCSPLYSNQLGGSMADSQCNGVRGIQRCCRILALCTL